MSENGPDWITAREAAELLASRQIDPAAAIGRLVSETGEYGVGRFWMLVERPFRYRGNWIASPEIDTSSGTIMAPMQIGRRRISEHRPVPFFVSRAEIDRRWPATSETSAPRSGGGRPSKIDDEAFKEAFRLKVEEEGGIPCSDQGEGWQRQADAEKWAAGWLEEKKTPLKEAAIRTRIRNMIAKLQKDGN